MIDQIDEVMNCDEIWSEEFFGQVQVYFLRILIESDKWVQYFKVILLNLQFHQLNVAKIFLKDVCHFFCELSQSFHM